MGVLEDNGADLVHLTLDGATLEQYGTVPLPAEFVVGQGYWAIESVNFGAVVVLSQITLQDPVANPPGRTGILVRGMPATGGRAAALLEQGADTEYGFTFPAPTWSLSQGGFPLFRWQAIPTNLAPRV